VSPPARGPGPLAGLRVIDCSTLIAGPSCARYLGDFGADVVKVERPGVGDASRELFRRDPADGIAYFWKLLSRNKRTIALDLKRPEDLAVMRQLCTDSHVLVENFRPGTLERLGLAPADLLRVNPKLVIVRVTGFGQDGPYASRPGFATLAEAMSGFADLNGEPDGPPQLPPIAITDEVAGLAGAFAAMVALHSGVGQIVDVSLLETLLQMMGPLVSAFVGDGYLQPRLGSSIPYSVPRGTWRTSDGKWVAISTSAQTVARRVLLLLGLSDDDRFQTVEGRVRHRLDLDAALATWIGQRTQTEVLDAFAEVEAAAGPVYDISDVVRDPHVRARGALVEVDGVVMQGLIARLSATPGLVRWAGRALDRDGAAIRSAARHPSWATSSPVIEPDTG
jgi:crotonobetainyl-CoA:carnitine CoA-transferase CaiB-like acyl-CoA transferase